MSINGALRIFSLASWVIYIPIGCSHPVIKYWQPLLAKTSATFSLPHPENERQRSVKGVSCCIFANQGFARIFAFITELLTTLRGKNSIYQRQNTDSKLIDITSCTACKNILLVVENAILIRYYKHTPKTRALYESMDGPAGIPADNRPNSDGFGIYNGTVPELTVWVDWKPGLPISKRFSLAPDPDQKWWSGTSANTSPQTIANAISDL